jgi:hypothetical protein
MSVSSESQSSKKRKIKNGKDVRIDIQLPTVIDSGDLSLAIEKELTAKYIGTFKMFRNQVTTKWEKNGLIPNRNVDQMAVKKLVARFSSGLDRMNPRHHMTATIDPKDLPQFLAALEKTQEQLLQASAKQDYRLITEQIWNKFNGPRFILQAGQHRFAAIHLIFDDETMKWWPIKIYIGDLTLDALDRTRDNRNEVHTGLNDGERIMHIAKYQSKLDELKKELNDRGSEVNTGEIEELTKSIRLKFEEFDAGSVPRAKQIWDRPALRRAIIRALDIPGVRAGFSLSAMGDILTLRTMGVSHPPKSC